MCKKLQNQIHGIQGLKFINTDFRQCALFISTETNINKILILEIKIEILSIKCFIYLFIFCRVVVMSLVI